MSNSISLSEANPRVPCGCPECSLEDYTGFDIDLDLWLPVDDPRIDQVIAIFASVVKELGGLGIDLHGSVVDELVVPS